MAASPASSTTTRLDIAAREPGHSRSTRRLRREGRTPGVLYGLGGDNLAFSVDSLDLRRALAKAGAVLELALDGTATPAVVKDAQRHPVRSTEIIHLDLVRVDLARTIQQTVHIELVGGDDSPGVREGGILEQITREVLVEALPTEIPETITFDVSELNVGDTVTLDALRAPAGVTLVDHSEETVLVTVTLPSGGAGEEDEIEAETEVVGEGEEGEDADAEAESSDDDSSGS